MNEIIKKFPFKNGLKLEFEIIDLSTILASKKDMMTIPHRAQFYHVLWIEKGEGTHFVDFKPIKIEDNTIIFIPQNSVNMYDKSGHYHGKSILFTDRFFSKNKADIQYLHSSMLYSDLYDTAKIKVNKDYSDLKIFLDAMETEYNRNNDKAQYPILHNLLHIFLLQAERDIKKQGFEELKPSLNLDYLVLFKDLLEKNFKKEKTVSKYAAKLNISEKQLHKACTVLLEKTPKTIINERILLEAKRLLVHSNKNIKEIAYNLGYDEPTNFVKYFKKNTNSTPSGFRKQF